MITLNGAEPNINVESNLAFLNNVLELTGSLRISSGSTDSFEIRNTGPGIGIGANALRFANSVFSNVAIGSSAMPFVLGGNNTALGDSAGQQLRAGDGNTFIGFAAGGGGGANTITGDFNIGMGYLPMGGLTTGNSNIGVGQQALLQLSTGNYNTAIGYQAGWNITIGENNTLVGNITGSASLSNHVIIADGAGVNRLISDDNNVTRFTNAIKSVTYRETFSDAGTGGSVTLDLSTANNFRRQFNGNATVTFSNPPASPNGFGFTLVTVNAGAYTITWPGSVDWAGGSAPTLTSSGTDVLVFYTYDGGTTYYGFVSGKNMN